MRWRRVRSHDKYLVSEIGDVVSPSGRLLSTYRSNNGRKIVTLHKNGERTRFLVYRLVLESFVGPCPDGMVACHNDGDIDNNHISNLRWDTMKNNHADKHRHGTQQTGENHPRSRFVEQDVLRMRDMRKCGAKLKDIAHVFDTDQATISNICLRKTWCHI